jgi:hypothetical protein
MRCELLLAAGLCAVLPGAVIAQEEKYEPLLESSAEEVAKNVAEEIRYGNPKAKLVILPLLNDNRSLTVTNSIRSQIASSGKLIVVEKAGFWQRVKEFFTSRDPLAETARSASEAIQIARETDADFVLFGVVEKRQPKPERYELEIKVRIVHIRTGDGILAGQYSNALEKGVLSLPYYRVWLYDKSTFLKILVWLIFMMVLPFVVLLFKEVAYGSRPLIPVIFVVAFTGLDVLLAYALAGFEFATLWSIMLFVLALAASIFWNLFIMNKIYAMSSGSE